MPSDGDAYSSPQVEIVILLLSPEWILGNPHLWVGVGGCHPRCWVREALLCKMMWWCLGPLPRVYFVIPRDTDITQLETLLGGMLPFPRFPASISFSDGNVHPYWSPVMTGQGPHGSSSGSPSPLRCVRSPVHLFWLLSQDLTLGKK